MKKIQVDFENIRLDRFIKIIFPKASQALIERSLRNKDILINGVKGKAADRISKSDTISYYPPIFSGLEEQYWSDQKEISQNEKILASKITDQYLLYEDENLLAINKPSNLAVQGGSKITISIDGGLRALNQQYNNQLKLVHRLDKNTSGVLIIAKGIVAAAKLADAFKNHLIDKQYVALLCGKIPLSGQVTHYLEKKVRAGQELVCINENQTSGKIAITDYQLIKQKDNYSLVCFMPKTGRMHQLRVVAQSLGAPILGDTKYGGKKHNRMMLHAQQIILPKQVFGKTIQIKSQISWQI